MDWKRWGTAAVTGGLSELHRPLVSGIQKLEDKLSPDAPKFEMPGYAARDASLNEFAQTRGGGEFRQGQSDLVRALQRQASGQDSFSQEQLRQNFGRLMAGQQSAVAGASPQNAAMAMRMGMQNQGQLGQQMAGQQALAGIAERNAANQALGGVLGQGRGQDIQAYTNAQQLGLQNAQGQMNGQMGLAGMPQGWEKLLGYGMQAAPMLLKSDRRAKKDIVGGGKYADELLDSLAPKKYKYKDERDGEGEQVGIMAQDLEKSVAGRMAVKNTPNGKYVDPARLSGALAAACARLHQRLNKVERRNG